MISPETKIQFEKIILELKSDLERYAQKDTANQKYIDRQSQLINNLIQVYNSTETLLYSDSWGEIEKIMRKTQLIDPSISGFTIQLRVLPTGNFYSLINYDPFKC